MCRDPRRSSVWRGEERKRGLQRTQRLQDFYRQAFLILPVDEPVSDEYGRGRAATEALGRPVAIMIYGSPPPQPQAPSHS